MKSQKPSISEAAKAGSDDGTLAISDAGPARHDEPVVLITNGGKGGAGKTALGHAAVHTALLLGKKPVIFDFDAANPDLWAGWDEVDRSDRFALEIVSFDGWESVMQTIRALDSSHIVIVDLPANAGAAVEPYLLPMMKVGGYYATLWALDPGRKPMDALVRYCAGPTKEPVVVAKSVFKTNGRASDFEVWSKFKGNVDLRGGFEFDVPVLESAVRVAMVEGGEPVMTIEDLSTDRGAWSIDRVARDEAKPLRADRAVSWLATMRPQIERAMASARRVSK